MEHLIGKPLTIVNINDFAMTSKTELVPLEIKGNLILFKRPRKYKRSSDTGRTRHPAGGQRRRVRHNAWECMNLVGTDPDALRELVKRNLNPDFYDFASMLMWRPDQLTGSAKDDEMPVILFPTEGHSGHAVIEGYKNAEA